MQVKLGSLRPIALSLALGIYGAAVAGCGNSTNSGDTQDLGSATDLGCVPGTAGCVCACPGQGQSTADVVCGQDMGLTCGLTCRGEFYDVDGKPQNGCEMDHSIFTSHNQATAAARGNFSCTDASSNDTILGFLLSDSRVHTNPPVTAFNAAVGSAPDYYSVKADGGTFCVNDYDVTFSTSGGGSMQCYQCTIVTDKKTQSVMANGNELVKMSSGSGSYSNNSVIYFIVEKICSLPQQESIRYQVLYHL